MRTEDYTDLLERAIKRGVKHLSNEDLVTLAIKGRSKNTATQLLDAIEKGEDITPTMSNIPLLAGMELQERRKPDGIVIKNPMDAFFAVRHFAMDNEHEYFIAIILDVAHKVSEIKIVSKGLINRTLVHPREVFSHALKLNATAIMLAHNHPSGLLDPSAEDISTTNRLVEAGGILGIQVIDHLVFSFNDCFSFKEHGLM